MYILPLKNKWIYLSILAVLAALVFAVIATPPKRANDTPGTVHTATKNDTRVKWEYRSSGESFEGVDMNNNGIWDHAEPSIATWSDGSADVKKALEQLALSLQRAARDAYATEEILVERYHAISRAGQCLAAVGGPEKTALIGAVTQKVLNTPALLQRFLDFHTQIGHEIRNVVTVGEKGCAFDPN